MTELTDLINILEKELISLETLREVVLCKQNAIVKHNYDALKIALTEEEAAIKGVTEHEQQRLAFIAHCIDDLDAKMQTLTLQEVVEQLNYTRTDELTQLEGRLRNTLQQITYLNDQNKMLVNNSMNFIKETINIVTQNKSRQLINRTV